MVRDQKAAGSNPATSTGKPRKIKASGVFFMLRHATHFKFIMYKAMYMMYIVITMHKMPKNVKTCTKKVTKRHAKSLPNGCGFD